MKIRNKATRNILLIMLGVSTCFFLWILNRNVEIVGIHQRDNYSDVLVKHFPLTDKGKIAWWLKNKDSIKNTYGIPKPSPRGFYTIVFWDFGDGYVQEGKYDRLCFNDMNTKNNCIDKNKVFSVGNDRNSDILFGVSDGIYRLKSNGSLTKTKYE